MFRPTLSVLIAVLGTSCVEEAEAEAPSRWVYVPPAATGATPDPGVVADAVARVAPLFASVDPAPLDALVDALAVALGDCAPVTFGDDRAEWVYWIDNNCADGSVEGFAYEVDQQFLPGDYPGLTGTARSVGWTADVSSGDLRLWGNATWGEQDLVYDDGTLARVRWLDGDIHTDAAHEPDWLADGVTPSVTAQHTVYPDGTVWIGVDARSVVDEPFADAISISIVADAACTEVSGTAAVHLRDGGWIDLALTEIDSDCTACGEVVDALGNPLGTTCIDATPLVAIGVDA